MKIVIAPDSFKETLSAFEVASTIESSFQNVFPEAEIIKIPIADGGEGTVEAMVRATDGSFEFSEVEGPMGNITSAKWGMLGNSKTAVIEIAEACGLHLVQANKRNPMTASSFGVGQLVVAALDKGAKKIIIGLGGSATNDGGYGFLRAIGVQFLDSEGNELNGHFETLSLLSDINFNHIDTRIKNTSIEIACDVDNPLLGEKGASKVFAAQKGASNKMIEELESIMTNYYEIISSQLGSQLNDRPGFGAAGGLGFGISAFINSELKSGINIVLEALNFNQYLLDADLVITGEGRIDSQSKRGKAPIGVIKYANQLNCKVIVIAGSVDDPKTFNQKFNVTNSYGIVNAKFSIEKAFEDPYGCLKSVSQKAAEDFKVLVT
ncbi:glycerate kinase [Candidatus Pseudothioglobus singularis]|uniref:Glycerate kinase n=1 Tax=Candidatus Pseudothioglobus singularis PS1 TaxID=1125411 RepID=A0A0M4M1T7_9GAMM|nr:glycerate kinase [Candidatus Pseudothioglobus singularis]ALE01467.1 glycerate kinase [Candidatus Pseudothioglobus singularis PS1]